MESREEDLEIIIVSGYKTRIILVIFYGVLKNIPWSIAAFQKNIQWKETLDFKTVMEVIKERLQPMAERYWRK